MQLLAPTPYADLVMMVNRTFSCRAGEGERRRDSRGVAQVARPACRETEPETGNHMQGDEQRIGRSRLREDP